MGLIQSYWKNNESIKLCDDIIDSQQFMIVISIYSMQSIPEYNVLLEYLQNTGCIASYNYLHKIYLLYDPAKSDVVLRSNRSGDIISGLSSDITRFCIVKKLCEPYYVEVDITIEPTTLTKEMLKIYIEQSHYNGILYGVKNLNETTLLEWCKM